jgi:hypothetical protein
MGAPKKIFLVLILFIVAAFVFIGGENSALSPATTASIASQNAKVDAFIARANQLQNVEIVDWRWSKQGFGNVMIATFTFRNKNDFAVKDVEVTCRHYANSGTLIDRNVRTIFEVVTAKKSKTVRDFNMGFIHNQANKSSCEVTDFKRA